MELPLTEKLAIRRRGCEKIITLREVAGGCESLGLGLQ